MDFISMRWFIYFAYFLGDINFEANIFFLVYILLFLKDTRQFKEFTVREAVF